MFRPACGDVSRQLEHEHSDTRIENVLIQYSPKVCSFFYFFLFFFSVRSNILIASSGWTWLSRALLFATHVFFGTTCVCAISFQKFSATRSVWWNAYCVRLFVVFFFLVKSQLSYRIDIKWSSRNSFFSGCTIFFFSISSCCVEKFPVGWNFQFMFEKRYMEKF